ncbi:hypothetical protein ASZ90_011219 [hydrocarbon metagenome]|uniref:Uncharacterized protein n=1 Tax=hydrocarbon metagenome TaxID=938273 RepID=A0A0W8FDU1_9ZZZZ
MIAVFISGNISSTSHMKERKYRNRASACPRAGPSATAHTGGSGFMTRPGRIPAMPPPDMLSDMALGCSSGGIEGHGAMGENPYPPPEKSHMRT